MYRYKNAVVKDRNGWSEKDISEETMRSIGQSYEDVRFHLDYQIEGITVEVHYTDIEPLIKRSIKTVAQWFIDNNNRALPHRLKLTNISNRQHVQMKDLWEAGYEIHITNKDVHPETALLPSACRDLLIRHPTYSSNDVYDNMAISINGLLYPTINSEYGPYLAGVWPKLRALKELYASVISFKRLGGFKQIPLTKAMVYQPSSIHSLKDSIYLNVGVDLSQKTVLLVLGGYLHVLDGNYQIIGDQQLKINSSQIPLTQRILSTQKELGLTLPGLDTGGGSINDKLLMSDDSLTKYIDLPNTFLMVLDKEVYYAHEVLTYGGMPDRYFSKERPMGIMQHYLGRIMDHRCDRKGNQYVLSGKNVRELQLGMETFLWHNKQVPTNRLGYKPWLPATVTQTKIFTYDV